MRVLALHPDVLVATSAIWRTNCVMVRGAARPPAGRGAAAGELADRPLGGASVVDAPEDQPSGTASATHETFVIDSPVLPEELDALPALLEHAGFPNPSGLLATHGDWDHLLGRLAFPEVALGCAESTAERMRATPGEAQRELRAFDEQYLIGRSRPLSLGAVQTLSAPGFCELGERQLELHAATGHTVDGMAIWVTWARVLVAGDYLSPSEIPTICERPEALDAYIETLTRLRPLVQEAEFVVPGHGPALTAADALRVLEQDLSYLRALAVRGIDAELPREARSAFQRELHRENVNRSSARSRAAH